jgi:L-methionine (R)-S-oxide reductase
MANLAALIYHSFRTEYGAASSVNWAGFYLLRRVESDAAAVDAAATAVDDEILLLGPFHGEPAVSLIRIGAGVCGSAVVDRETQIVADVHSHPNHIACDSASRSEIVVPIYDEDEGALVDGDIQQRRMVGVLDIDSPLLGFFTAAEDRRALEAIVDALGRHADWSILDARIRVDIPGQQEKTASAHIGPDAMLRCSGLRFRSSCVRGPLSSCRPLFTSRHIVPPRLFDSRVQSSPGLHPAPPFL